MCVPKSRATYPVILIMEDVLQTRRLESAPIKAEHLLALDWILWRKREAMEIITEISMQIVRPQAAEENISALSASTVNLNTNSACILLQHNLGRSNQS